MFNVMRGGIFADGYKVHTQDFIEFISVRNRTVLEEHAAFFSELPSRIEYLSTFMPGRKRADPQI